MKRTLTDKVDINALLLERKRQIDKGLEAILPGEDTAPRALHRAMRYSVFSGGKRIRPILTIESCLCCGGSVKDALTAACSIELVHTFSLIHDDLPAMDNDDYRRGRITCHKKFGEATAILAGDSLLSLAFEALAGYRDAKIASSLAKELGISIGSLGMAGGQAVDMEYKNKKKDIKTLEYINVHKTADLIKAGLKMGAISAGASPEKVNAMGEFGLYTGEVFQIVDDLLDKNDSARVLGEENAKTRAKILTKKAQTTLICFGKKAGALKDIAFYLTERKS